MELSDKLSPANNEPAHTIREFVMVMLISKNNNAMPPGARIGQASMRPDTCEATGPFAASIVLAM